MAAPMPHRHSTAAEYERMVEMGILTEDERIELLGGEIYQMAAIGARHAHVVNVLSDLLWMQVRSTAFVSVQNLIQLDDESMPEPDIVALRRRNHAVALPTPVDVLLVIEVADSSRETDRGMKFPRYAIAGTPRRGS